MTCRPLLFCFWLAFLITDQVFCLRAQLEMYEDSLDDQYIGCLDKMESIAPELMKKERELRPDLDVAWNTSSAAWNEKKSSVGHLPDGFKDEYGVALLLYTYMDLQLYKELNRAVREYGQHPNSFMFHSWHFYLTRALSLLRAGCDGNPWSTYRGTSTVQFEPPSDPQATIRLSQFSSSSADIKQAQQFGQASFFNITTCFGADIEKFSHYPSQKEVLIPVDEVFHVTKYIKEGNRLILQTTNRRCSFYNCAYLGGSKRRSCVYNSAPSTVKFYEAVTGPLLVAMCTAIFSVTR
ncbi:ecto-ADP-ribosyltransferase 5-like [Bufo bufo]|uniref:ecto-ADP-ribosyltransferase 5-like n=1 Tax=Bufo bufo TaxID=8384 RepID=UPI001ABDD860|nr:ecto-ADP-ribosyltransferase 5-like [Bufo bufo]XP_040278601.1 ecto-ADP-ribosyltransferase 5-like [Bufo bufo]XP_040278602.1 ecto-ADP-ribosyltransferase 5-like [Bufo bufo]XP_040278603.1 ecto-ADP-ribosyltransferase 5-like [Bufo bufo]XP_040278604.1 ecto-ADP-ribosyltransferase 5-like [Bufo bufo]